MLAGEEQELAAVLVHRAQKDLHRGIDDATELELVTPHLAQGGAEGFADFGHQGQAEGVHVLEVAVEAGRHDAGGACHLTQAQAAEGPATVQQLAGCIHQRLAGGVV
ncbi:hypothetical protein SRABI70_04662 [Pseudomonas sp. Bi70]|nr:hypothetical protein SRABI70_04662 [Pseudomonas sp. Bi70]